MWFSSQPHEMNTSIPSVLQARKPSYREVMALAQEQTTSRGGAGIRTQQAGSGSLVFAAAQGTNWVITRF